MRWPKGFFEPHYSCGGGKKTCGCRSDVVHGGSGGQKAVRNPTKVAEALPAPPKLRQRRKRLCKQRAVVVVVMLFLAARAASLIEERSGVGKPRSVCRGDVIFGGLCSTAN